MQMQAKLGAWGGELPPPYVSIRNYVEIRVNIVTCLSSYIVPLINFSKFRGAILSSAMCPTARECRCPHQNQSRGFSATRRYADHAPLESTSITKLTRLQFPSSIGILSLIAKQPIGLTRISQMAYQLQQTWKSRFERPRIHFTANSWINDPCAPGYDPWTNTYHVFYQCTYLPF
jgi:hypothetical protein